MTNYYLEVLMRKRQNDNNEKKFGCDPYLVREQEKYDNPIASREHILDILKQVSQPLSMDDISEALKLDESQMLALKRRLRAMVRDGQLMLNRGYEYCIPDKMNLTRGRVVGHREGYGYVVSESGNTSLFINNREMRKVFDGDKVLAACIGEDRRGRKEGRIVEVLARGVSKVVGYFFEESGIAFIEPLNQKISQTILVNPETIGHHTIGDLVTVEITTYPTFRTQAIGDLVESLGHLPPVKQDIEIALRSYSLPYQWPDEMAEALKAFGHEIPKESYTNRVDLRDLPFVTIDGEDAKDFDDAVYATPVENGYTLYVAIADVDYYVRPNSTLDKEAYHRGTSVYFPTQVVPMLPAKLSNGLCSLKPNVDRLSHVCKMHITSEGQLASYEFIDAVISSSARLTYTQVTQWIKAHLKNESTLKKQLKKETDKQKKSLLTPIFYLLQVYYSLSKARKARGAIDFDTVETQFKFNNKNEVVNIIPCTRHIAHLLIEECMLVANMATAQFLIEHKLPGLFRVHDVPPKEKLNDLKSFLKLRGLTLKGGATPTPHDYMVLLAQAKKRDDFNLIQTVLLRSMSLSVYSPDNKGHFGLALDAYVQFTSPIRRYPDLLAHRIIRAYQKVPSKPLALHKLLPQVDDSTPDLATVGDVASLTERRADEASRDVDEALKCDYMKERIGQTFKGTISGVTNFGFFVTLDEYFVEGLVHVSALVNDYYDFDATHQHLIGQVTKMRYQLGDKVTVTLLEVNKAERKIDFEIPNLKPITKKKKKRRK